MLLQAQNVSKSYGKFQALRNINLELKKGLSYGLIGLNGSGKTSLIELITGSQVPTEGTLTVLGKNVLENTKEIHTFIGYAPENPPLYLDMTIIEYLKFIANIKGLKQEELKDSLKEVIEIFEIKSHSHQIIKTLSHGLKQRVNLAQAFLGKPIAIVLDEPTNGLDPHQIIQLRYLIKIKQTEKTSFIISSHLLSEITNLCEDIILLSKGSIETVKKIKDLDQKISSLQNFDLILLPSFHLKETFFDSQNQKIFKIISYQEYAEEVKVSIQLTPNQKESELFRWISTQKLSVKSAVAHKNNLESLFQKRIMKGDIQ